MKDALSKVRRALTTSSIVPQLSFIRVHDGVMSATDGRLYAAAPTTCKDNFVVSGRQLEKALALGDDVNIKFDGEFVHFSHGRTRVKIQKVPGDTFPVEVEPASWNDFDASFLFALRRVRAFISDNATHSWSLAAHAHERGVCATNNVVLADVDFDAPPIRGLIPFWLIDFLDGVEIAPTECFSDEHSVYLRWHDGAWLRALRVTGVFPEPALGLCEQLRSAPLDGFFALTDEWRSAYKKTLEFAENEVVVGPTAISTRSAQSEVETEISTDVDRQTLWDKRFLAAVLTHATHWRLSDYPKPAPWYGAGIRGIICGKTGL